MNGGRFEVEFAIVGAGVAGLWLGAELLRRGSRVLLIDYRFIGQYASSRNQGWLHSGSMYAVLNGSTLPGQVAPVCLESNGRLKHFCRRHCPDAILKPQGALFLFQNADKAKAAASNVEKLGVPISWVTKEQIHGYESRLASTIFSFGFLSMTDCAFVARPILNALVRMNEMRGASFIGSACPLPEIKIEKRSSGWSLFDGAVTVVAAKVVLCAGAMNPLLLRIITGRDPDIHILRSFIGVFHTLITRRIVRIDAGPSAIMFCPFPGGTTVNAWETDVDSQVQPELQPDPYIIKNFEPQLSRVLRLSAGEKMHFYTCEKLNNTNSARNPYPAKEYGNRHYFWTDESDGLYSFYPGKFMAVPLACEDLASTLIPQPSVGRIKKSEAGRPAPLSVPELPVYSAPTHVAGPTDGGRIEIISLRPVE